MFVKINKVELVGIIVLITPEVKITIPMIACTVVKPIAANVNKEGSCWANYNKSSLQFWAQ